MQPPLPCLAGRQPGSIGGAPRPRRQPLGQGQGWTLPSVHSHAAWTDRDGEQVRGFNGHDEAEGDRPGQAEEVFQAQFGGLDTTDDGGKEWTVRHVHLCIIFLGRVHAT